jgi:hypothetical protein
MPRTYMIDSDNSEPGYDEYIPTDWCNECWNDPVRGFDPSDRDDHPPYEREPIDWGRTICCDGCGKVLGKEDN